MQVNDRLEKENKGVEINTNIVTPGGFASNKLNTRRLRTKAKPVSPPVVLPRTSSVSLDRYETLDR